MKIVVDLILRLYDEFLTRLIRLASGFYSGEKLRIKGKPLIHAWDGATIQVGKNVQLNSRNRGYHVSMYGPVKLFAESKGAIIKIGDNTRIHGSCIHALNNIEIGRNCLIAANCQLIDSNGHDLLLENPAGRIHSKSSGVSVMIEDNVWLGTGCIVLPGVTIGEGSVVAANSVVSRNIPSRVLAGGNPAVVIKPKA
jgi:acetyltransferase-like isoleucine patch superfamily enzyme